MGLRSKPALSFTGRFPLVLVAPEETNEAIEQAIREGFRFLDMSATQDATGKIRVALLFEALTASAGTSGT